ncbi:UDP-glucose 4-epimerase GalE [Methylopila henanensis]|uniref:UDP-glucose 4-epimerase n=1 Tax=Methylopila henanensis TaxID=873516 RepID=A0ABW4K7W5_9HYPH
MTVLITGGAGYIGAHMVLAMREQGRSVVVLDDLSTGAREALPEDVPLVVGDVGDETLVLRTIAQHGVTAVAHFAAKIVVPDSVRDPLGTYLANTGKTRSLLSAVVAAGVTRFIFSSTAAVYGLLPPTPTPEDAPVAPASPYGTSKLMSEWILRDAAAAHGLSYVVLRYFNVAGADPAMRTGQRAAGASNLITLATRAALGLRAGLDILGTDLPTPDGTGVRDYIHVADLAAAHVAALDYLGAGGPSVTLNCGYGRGFSVREVVAAVNRAAGLEIATREAPRRPGDPFVSVADARQIRDRLDWTPKLDDLDLIVRHALEWERRYWIGSAERQAEIRRLAS